MRRIGLTVFVVALLAVPSAAAKEFRPGDLRVCGGNHCVSIANRPLLRILSGYYYGSGQVLRAARVPRGAPGFELRYKNGFASGMVATKELDRFRAYGFYCGRFERGRWYVFPARAAAALRKLTAGMRPMRVAAPPRSC